MQFDFGPRHRIVTRTARFPWVRVLLTVATGVALGFMLLAACGIAHAETPIAATAPARQAFEQFNDECRGRGIEASCDRRDQIGRRLQAMGVCWNPHSATEAQAWVPCVTPKPQTAQSLDHALSVCASDAAKADQVTRFRNQMVPKRFVLDWGFPAPLVDAVYDHGAYSYRSLQYCYSLENIERLRALGLT